MECARSADHRAFDSRTPISPLPDPTDRTKLPLMIAAANSVAKLVIPEKARRFIRYCIDSQYRAAKGRERDRMLTKLIFEQTKGRILGGPFRDMQFIPTNILGSYMSCKLLGTYERELNPIVDKMIAKGYRTIVNIGAGEGYYGVGLAKRVPGAKVICYEIDQRNQEVIREHAELNGVSDRVEVNGKCDPACLSERLERAEEPIAVVCDVEGYEYDLLDPLLIAQLRNADVLVELHDMFRKGVSKALKNRFAPTHTVTRLHRTRRTRADFPSQVNLDPSLHPRALDEDRGGTMYWYWMEAKHLPRRHEDAKGTSAHQPDTAVAAS